MHLQSRRLALSGVLCALAVAILLLGGLIPVAVYCCPILAALVLLPIREECGTRLALTAWGAVSLLAVLLVPDKELAAVYLFFGWYPAAQPGLDRIRSRLLRLVCKLLLFNASAAGMYAGLLFLFQLDAVAAEFAACAPALLAALVGMANITFLITDLVVRRMALLWRVQLRKKWFR